MKQFAIIRTISNFDRKQSYGHLGLSKSIKPVKRVAVEDAPVTINKCVNTTTTRKKRVIDPSVKEARKQRAWSKGSKPVLLVSSKLN